MSPDPVLVSAEDCLDRGDFVLAERLCRQALARDDCDAEALRLLATVALRKGGREDAVTFAQDAVAADSSAASQVTLGQMLVAVGRHAQAIIELQRAVELDPTRAQAHFFLGVAYSATRSAAAAEDAFRAALAIWGDYPEAHGALGCLLLAEGHTAEAIGELTTAVRLQPRDLDAIAGLAEARVLAGDAEGALAAYKDATEAAPGSAQAWHALGHAYLSRGHNAEAETAFRRGIDIAPDQSGCLLGLAGMLEAMLRWEEAAERWRQVLARTPEHADALKGLARALFAVGHLPEALHLTRRASELVPQDADAHYGMGNVLLRLQRPQESLASYRRALALVQSPKARFAAASPLLMLGDFDGGWEAYEARLGMRGVPWKIANVRERLWDGGAIGRQRLLVHTEQGIGDTLQFIRYLPLLRERVGPDAHIALLCEPELAGVVASVGGIDSLHAPEKIGDIDYDLQVPLLSLPHRFGATLKSIPSIIPYIRLPAGVTARIERARDTKLAIAIAWAGRPTHGDDRMRSCSIQCFAPLFELAGAQFFSIQVGPRAAEIEPYLGRPNVASVSDQLTNLAQTLAVIDQVDLVIAVDTSVVHLAGAYGKPVWTLLAFGGEWRWMLNRDDTPWYPSMRLFRQRLLGDWDEVFRRVRAQLEAMIEKILIGQK
jgi:tetratricopeptide (TPR) repeat protein